MRVGANAIHSHMVQPLHCCAFPNTRAFSETDKHHSQNTQDLTYLAARHATPISLHDVCCHQRTPARFQY